MTDRYTDLRDLLDLTQTNVFNRDDVRALLADYDRMREALNKLRRGFVAARGNAEAMFRESGSIYHEGRRVAYDQAFTDVRAALAQEGS